MADEANIAALPKMSFPFETLEATTGPNHPNIPAERMTGWTNDWMNN